MILRHLPALIIVLPLMSAPLCVVMRHGRATWALATAISWAALAMAVKLLMTVQASGPIVYLLGDWQAPWGIEYKVDLLNAFMLVIVAAIGAVVSVYARKSVDKEIPAERHYLFYSMYLLCLTGLMGIAITGDAFNLFVFLEISSLSSYVLISLGRDRRALTAAYRYLIMGTIGATFYIIGVGLMYMMTGTLNIGDLATLLPAVVDTRTIQVALAFLTVGICLKLALFPLHMWLPNAYAYAPSAVTVFLAATATKIAIYALVRTYFTMFGATGVVQSVALRDALMTLAVLGMFAGSIVAIYQTDIKRMLAYSSIAQVGYMILGIGFATATGLTGGLLHVFNHALMKGALFMAVGGVVYRIGSAHIDGFRGLGRKMPLTMAAFVAGGLGLIGVPLTVGFVSKWYLILAALEKGWWWIAVLVVLSSLLAVIYVWRVVEVAYFKEPADPDAPVREAPKWMLIPTWILVAASIWFGVDATRTVGVARGAAEFLLKGAS